MDSIYIISVRDFSAYLSKIVAGTTVFWIHVAVGTNFANQAGKLGSEFFATLCIPFTDRDSYYQSVKYHATIVTFVDGKLLCIEAWTSAGKSGMASIPWLVVGGIYHGSSYAGLQKHGVDMCFLQAVKDRTKLLFLFLC